MEEWNMVIGHREGVFDLVVETGRGGVCRAPRVLVTKGRHQQATEIKAPWPFLCVNRERS